MFCQKTAERRYGLQNKFLTSHVLGDNSIRASNNNLRRCFVRRLLREGRKFPFVYVSSWELKLGPYTLHDKKPIYFYNWMMPRCKYWEASGFRERSSISVVWIWFVGIQFDFRIFQMIFCKCFRPLEDILGCNVSVWFH